MKVGKLALEYAGKFLIPKIWNDVRDSVSVAEKNPDLTSGKAKKDFVIDRMKVLGYDLAEGLLNFGIELAWMWLQAYLGKPILAKKDKLDI